jgi:hypothetical protein
MTRASDCVRFLYSVTPLSEWCDVSLFAFHLIFSPGEGSMGSPAVRGLHASHVLVLNGDIGPFY